MAPPRSAVWRYFKRSADDKSVKCNLCSTELAYKGSTTSMASHLKSQHPQISTSSPAKQQSQLSSFIISTKKTPASMKETITEAIADMVVSDYLPLSIVEGAGFRKLMSIVAPDYDVPCRKTVRSRILKRYDEEKAALVTGLSDVTAAAITTDTWTSTSSDSYMTVTQHHISDDWLMTSNVLMTREMPERHTGVNLANKLQDCVAEFGLQHKIESCVHDNARNMEAAGELCDQWSDLGCFAHTLQLCIKPALEVPQVEKTVAKCRKLVGHFRHSTSLTAELRKRQGLFNLPSHALIQDVCTRWNSTQMMLERLVEQRRVLTDVILDTSVSKKADSQLLPSEREWEQIAEVSAVLKDLTKVTTFISGEEDVSTSYIFPIVCGLLTSTLKEDAEDSGVVKRVKECIRQELQRRFQPSDVKSARSLPAVAALLDPRYKRLAFFTSEQRRAAEEALETRLDDVPLRPRARESSEPAPKVAKTAGLDFLQFAPSDECNDADELRDYLCVKPVDKTPLAWWKENCEKFPRLSVVAKRVLSVPATSVPSERVFSSAGILINKLRNRLSPPLVDSIIFLNKNSTPEAELSSED